MSEAREIAIAIIPKFPAFASVLGSGFIIYDILCSHFNISPVWWRKETEDVESSGGLSRRTNSLASARARSSRRCIQRKTLKNSAYYRLMLSMSISDFIVSFAWFSTTWPIPKDEFSLDNPSDSLYGNIGTERSCTTQGFFIQLGIVTPFYNAILACYYYLTIRREWKEEDFKRKVEYAGHFITVSFGLGTSIAGLVMKLYNNAVVWCWIAPYPLECGTNPDDECVRGKNSGAFRWAFYYGPLWVMIFLVAFFMTLVYLYVRGLDVKMDQYTRSYRKNAASARTDSGSSEMINGNNNRRRSIMARTFSTMNTEAITEQRRQRRNERSKAVANQGLFYAGTFALVWVFGTITRAMQLAGKKPPWAITFLFAVFTPSQGFFNFLVYVRPRLIKYFNERRKLRQDKSNSKNAGSNFSSSDILHVSGVSGSSNEVVTNENQNRDNSARSDLEISDPFTKSKTESETSDRNAKVRFAETPDINHSKVGFKEPNSTKVRFFTDDTQFIKRDNSESDDSDSNDSELDNPEIGKVTVGVTFEKGETLKLPEIGAIDMDDDDDRTDSEATLDPVLLSSLTPDEEDEKEESLTVKEDGDGIGVLHNATIDLATGEVRTRRATRRITSFPKSTTMQMSN